MDYKTEMDQLNKTFFDSYDPHYWKTKMNINMRMLNNIDSLYDGFFPEEKVLTKTKVKQHLELEIHYTYYHMLEALFALMFSLLQDDVVPWIWLSSIKRNNLKKFNRNIGKILEAKYNEVFGLEPDGVIKKFIYPNIDIENKTIQGINWAENVKALSDYMKCFAADLLDKIEYNSYKHGFRVFCGESSLAIGAQGGNIKHQVIAPSSTNMFLLVKEDSDAVLEYSVLHKTLDFKRSLKLSEIAYVIICQAINTRKTIINKENGCNISFFSLNDYRERSQKGVGMHFSMNTRFESIQQP